ncbi:chaplin [Streptomyces sp. DT24]|uniref:chaplin n=1 Tax=unclassified Streptomyces TaxID=2593676 RepID=UPI0023B8CB74|nr:chaplin [Streptomyces sp. AM 4-1-1]WEH36525.1 chaplin [Streptomyces sp. AM 4-1-1]
MRQALNKSMLIMAAASGILTATGGHAYADASAGGAAVGSPGVGSGNAVQVPVHIPVNLCGNTVDVVGLLNPAFGNSCANVSGGGGSHSAQGADAEAVATNSPGVLSGNVVQVPVDVPVNACGNSVDVVGVLNPTFGNGCVNASDPVGRPPVDPPRQPPTHHQPPTHTTPPTHHTPPAEPPLTPDEPPITPETPPATPEEPPLAADEPALAADDPAASPAATAALLADTGAGQVGLAAGAGAALLLGGTVLMRRTRASRN